MKKDSFTNSIQAKVLPFDDLIEKVKDLRNEGKIIVQSHGIFDLIHPGIIRHLNEAKKQGDVLIVTVIKDKNVRKIPGRPVFPGKMRLENVASLTQVDYVCLVDDSPPFHCVKLIASDIFAKGEDYLVRDKQIHGEGFHSTENNLFGKSRIYETKGFSFSSSQILNSLMDIYPEKTKIYIRELSKRYTFDDIVDKLNSLKGMKVLLIGDGIIDEYHYCESMGKSPKSQLIVNKYLTQMIFAGGVFAIANHIAGICDEVQLVTLLGKEDSREHFILKNLKPNVSSKFFYKKDGPTVIKKRYVNQHQNRKIFEINFLNDSYISNGIETDIIDYLAQVLSNYDLVLVSDFGHGFITKRLLKIIEEHSKILAVNSQTNGANSGFNLITKYNNSHFICLDAPEARLATQEKYAGMNEVGEILFNNLTTDNLIITLGSQGSLCITKRGVVNITPSFAAKVVDTIGAGDAFFAYTAPCFANDMPIDLVSFIGNCVGALSVQIVGNKRPVEKYELLEFIHSILK